MSVFAARSRAVNRALSAVLVGMLAALGLTLATAPIARAASDSHVTAEIVRITLHTDVNGNGRFDVGDA
jgi:hypothetical protein